MGEREIYTRERGRERYKKRGGMGGEEEIQEIEWERERYIQEKEGERDTKGEGGWGGRKRYKR